MGDSWCLALLKSCQGSCSGSLLEKADWCSEGSWGNWWGTDSEADRRPFQKYYLYMITKLHNLIQVFTNHKLVFALNELYWR